MALNGKAVVSCSTISCMRGLTVPRCQFLIVTHVHGFSHSSKYLMFFYDVETTGLGINDDRIVEIGAAVFGDASKPNVTFNQLVYTDVRIPRRGISACVS